MNYTNIRRSTAISSVARAVKKIISSFPSIKDIINPFFNNQYKTENIIVSPVRISAKRNITLMHNRLK